MDHLIACIFCGGIDPTNDSMLVQIAIAGAVTTPWMLRARLRAALDRLRGVQRPPDQSGDSCAVPQPQAGDAPTNEA